MKKGYRVLVEGGIEGLTFSDLYITTASGLRKAVIVRKGELVPTAQIDEEVLSRSLTTGALGRCLQRGWVEEVNLDDTSEQVVHSFSHTGRQTLELEPGSYVVSTVQPSIFKDKQEDEAAKEAGTVVPEPESDSDLPESVIKEGVYFCTECHRNHKIDSKVGKSHLGFRQKTLAELDSDPVDEEPTLNIVVRDEPAADEGIDLSMEPEDVETYEDFSKLVFFSKMKFIQSSSKLDVIKDIMEKSDNKQVINNARLRLLKEKYV